MLTIAMFRSEDATDASTTDRTVHAEQRHDRGVKTPGFAYPRDAESVHAR
jgi:hypothetical protein